MVRQRGAPAQLRLSRLADEVGIAAAQQLAEADLAGRAFGDD
jgi:hypothetical protein